MAYKNHSKFLYRNYDEIQDGINSGLINAFDIVFTSDTKEIILVKDDLSLSQVNSKVYRYASQAIAEKELNANKDTYEGQIISIFKGTAYQAYIVNRNNFGKFYVTSLAQSVTSGEVNYDVLNNRPITNLSGVLGNPIICDTLDSGIYRIAGTYKISNFLDTIFSGASSSLFLVEQGTDTVKIKRISADDTIEYKVSSGIVTSTKTVTENWIENKGYLDKSELNAELEKYLLKTEVEKYVAEVIGNMVGDIIDMKIDSKLKPATEAEALDVFINVFEN